MHPKKLERTFRQAPSEQKRFVEFCATELLEKVFKHAIACGLPPADASLCARQVAGNASATMGTFLRIQQTRRDLGNN